MKLKQKIFNEVEKLLLSHEFHWNEGYTVMQALYNLGYVGADKLNCKKSHWRWEDARTRDEMQKDIWWHDDFLDQDRIFLCEGCEMYFPKSQLKYDFNPLCPSCLELEEKGESN